MVLSDGTLRWSDKKCGICSSMPHKLFIRSCRNLVHVRKSSAVGLKVKFKTFKKLNLYNLNDLSDRRLIRQKNIGKVTFRYLKDIEKDKESIDGDML